MRFFTVRTAVQARRSVVWAMVIIGGFLCDDAVSGLRRGAPRGFRPISRRSMPAATWPVPLLAQYIGGGPDSFLGNFMLAFVSAVAFATIVAVVAGLVLASASAMAHDLFVGVIRAGKETTPRGQVVAARVATLIVGAPCRSRSASRQRAERRGARGLAFAVAASANFPCVLLTLYWKRCNTGGIVTGMLVGTIAASA
jgi:cation/acetate symporter